MNLLTSSLGFTCHQQRQQTNRLHRIPYIKETRSPSHRKGRTNCLNRRGRYDVCTGGAASACAHVSSSQCTTCSTCTTVFKSAEVKSSKFKVQCFRVSSIYTICDEMEFKALYIHCPRFLWGIEFADFPMSRHHSVIYLITNCSPRRQLLWPIQWFYACMRLWAD